MNQEDPRAALMRLITDARRTQCVRVAAELGLAELLADGPKSSGDLAVACRTREPFLRRLLRALVALEVLDEGSDGSFALTPVGEELRSDRLGPAARHLSSDEHWRTWGQLEHTVRTGEIGFERAHGMPSYEYYGSHPEAGVRFDAAMAAQTSGLAKAIVEACDFSRFGVVVDVGGGDGTLLIEILRACPQTRGVLLDLQRAIDRAYPKLEAAGLLGRCALEAGSFREHVPEGGEAYVLKSVLMDWSDEDVIEILGHCRKAMGSGSRLVIVQRLMPERVSRRDAEVLLSDLNMMVNNRGRERSVSEFRDLLGRAGFRLDQVVPTTTSMNVLEAVPA